MLVSHCSHLGVSGTLEAEPWLEDHAGRPPLTVRPNGNLTWGKNPRKLQVQATGSAEVITLSVHYRVLIPKQALEGRRRIRVDASLPGTEEASARRLGKRYFRLVFPDAFNDRVRPVTGRIRGVLKKPGGTVLAGLYLILNSDDELSPDDAYEVVLRSVMEVKDYNDEELKALALQAMKAVAVLLGQLPDVELKTWGSRFRPPRCPSMISTTSRGGTTTTWRAGADGAARAVDP